jgi:ribonuclease-3 family protein
MGDAMDKLLTYLQEKTGSKLTPEDVRMMHPLVLAYIGDTIYDLFVRSYLIITQPTSVHKLHVKAISFVKAGAQSDTLHHIEGILTDEEQDIVRRGRNAKSATMPKNADAVEYRWATGFETLLGYLYLLGRQDRLLYIIGCILELDDKEDE